MLQPQSNTPEQYILLNYISSQNFATCIATTQLQMRRYADTKILCDTESYF